MNVERMTNFESDTLILYVLEVAVLYRKHFIGHPHGNIKWKFKERRIHIQFFQVPSIVCLFTHCNDSAKCRSDGCLLQ